VFAWTVHPDPNVLITTSTPPTLTAGQAVNLVFAVSGGAEALGYKLGSPFQGFGRQTANRRHGAGQGSAPGRVWTSPT
jgi:hypothetical protein